MTYIALCGLHGAGKSFLAETLSSIQMWPVIEKRTALKKLHRDGYTGFGVDDSNWETWYKSIYKQVGSASILRHVLSTFNSETSSKFQVIDSVHTLEEWFTLKELDQNSRLLLVCAPEAIRHTRMDEPPEMDDQRASYWHSDTSCLMRYVDWAITSTVSEDLFHRQCDAFIHYATNTT